MHVLLRAFRFLAQSLELPLLQKALFLQFDAPVKRKFSLIAICLRDQAVERLKVIHQMLLDHVASAS